MWKNRLVSVGAITDASGNVTDTFAYDTYGKLISRTGETDTVFLYDGRDGVVTDANGLLYMRARYYSPELRRFVNADVIAGSISNAVTLNRYAYANGNPVSNIDPFGLEAERGNQEIFDSILEEINSALKIFCLSSTINGYKGEVYVGLTKYYYEISGTLGEGDINVLDILKKEYILLCFCNEFPDATISFLCPLLSFRT